MGTTVRPNAKATPRKPIPRSGKPAAITALPQPPKTSQKVPTNSANPFCILLIGPSPTPAIMGAPGRAVYQRRGPAQSGHGPFTQNALQACRNGPRRRFERIHHGLQTPSAPPCLPRAFGLRQRGQDGGDRAGEGGGTGRRLVDDQPGGIRP